MKLVCVSNDWDVLYIMTVSLLACHYGSTQNRPEPLVPVLQELPPNWSGGRWDDNPDSSASTPTVGLTSADGVKCNAYFYSPISSQPNALLVSR